MTHIPLSSSLHSVLLGQVGISIPQILATHCPSAEHYSFSRHVSPLHTSGSLWHCPSTLSLHSLPVGHGGISMPQSSCLHSPSLHYCPTSHILTWHKSNVSVLGSSGSGSTVPSTTQIPNSWSLQKVLLGQVGISMPHVLAVHLLPWHYSFSWQITPLQESGRRWHSPNTSSEQILP